MNVQAMSQPTPGQDDLLAEAAMKAQGALNPTTGLPALGPVNSFASKLPVIGLGLRYSLLSHIHVLRSVSCRAQMPGAALCTP